VPPRRDSLGATSTRHFDVVVTTNFPPRWGSSGSHFYPRLLCPPPGLKPASLLALSGTAEAVPFPKPLPCSRQRTYEIAYSYSRVTAIGRGGLVWELGVAGRWR
jgi:hypothetical protein